MAAPIKPMSTPVLPTRKTFNTALPSFSLPNPLRKGPNIRSENAELQRKVEDATAHYQAKAQEVREAQARARAAEVEAEALRQMARRFWEEEWSSMGDFMMVFSNEEHVKEIEARILAEYDELFEEKGRRMRDGGESETERVETVVSKLSSGSLSYVPHDTYSKARRPPGTKIEEDKTRCKYGRPTPRPQPSTDKLTPKGQRRLSA